MTLECSTILSLQSLNSLRIFLNKYLGPRSEGVVEFFKFVDLIESE